ncbi:DUF2642 domain-containing protein [Pseudoneobacillus rhizosphaerae]|jgi:hypothetical protein|uniref:DUF2642 domain-containing protein n=1 Tax=Pseudoneobacillus rhizosphaerae TaxID=2880968 RepID=A0A9C7G8A7_9BACI|nr:DUF2642 domain-containing protein [Pseudoneobacillus rhizosphaerae]CAG9607881.1 hypothetical protein NEOCIP111885_01573 [Pseudoneobacillus rhizosphaerae]
MLIDFVDLIGKKIEVEISGGVFHKGILIDSGVDIIVLYQGSTNSYLYIPFVHVQRLKETIIEEEDTAYNPTSEKPIETDVISFYKALTIAKGLFIKVYVTGNKSIHGYLTNIMNDYIVFHSPVYKTMLISINHVKWIIPYPPNKTPYSLKNENLSITPVTAPLAKTFDEQLKKLENELVIIDGGENTEKIGLLQKVRNNKMILITAEAETVYRNIEHIKSIQLP